MGTGAFLTAIENRLPSNLNIGISIGLAMTCILAVKGVLRIKTSQKVIYRVHILFGFGAERLGHDNGIGKR